MATITVRGLDDDLRDRLRLRAAEHGRSMEAEVRAILADTLAPERPPEGVNAYDWLRRRFPDGVDMTGFELPERTGEARAAVFDW